MRPEPFRIGFIGFGFAKLYATAFRNVGLVYANLPAVTLAAVATTSEKSAQAAQDHFGFESATTDYRKLLADPSLDGVAVVVPNGQHLPVLIDALDSDKAILTDKPLTANLEQARILRQKAQERGRDLMVNFEYRFSPAIRRARELIQSGRLGEITSFQASYYRSSYLDPQRPVRWKGDPAQRGGAFDDLGAHLLDMLVWMVGLPDRVAARKRTLVSSRPDGPVGTEDHAWALLDYDSGISGVIQAGRMVPGANNDMTLEIVGRRGALRWASMDGNYLDFADAGRPAAETGWTRLATMQTDPDAFLPPADQPVGMMRYQIAAAADFVRKSRAGQPFDPGLEQGYAVQRVLEAVQQSSDRSAWVSLADLP